MTRRVWHKGPPPHVGWWNASTARVATVWRWWDGQCWSEFASDCLTPKQAAFFAKFKVGRFTQTRIEWTSHYPKNARVPRVKP